MLLSTEQSCSRRIHLVHDSAVEDSLVFLGVCISINALLGDSAVDFRLWNSVDAIKIIVGRSAFKIILEHSSSRQHEARQLAILIVGKLKLLHTVRQHNG